MNKTNITLKLLRIRSFLLAFVLLCSTPLVRSAIAQQASPNKLTGTTIHYEIFETDLSKYFAEMKSLGMTTALIIATKSKAANGCDSSEFAWFSNENKKPLGVATTSYPDRLVEIVKQAKTNGINLYIGLLSSEYQCTASLPNPDPSNESQCTAPAPSKRPHYSEEFWKKTNADIVMPEVTKTVQTIIQTLNNAKENNGPLQGINIFNYGGNAGVIKGWYIPDEADFAAWPVNKYYMYNPISNTSTACQNNPSSCDISPTPGDVTWFINYYQRYVQAIKQGEGTAFSQDGTTHLLTVVSCYLSGTRENGITPDQVADRAQAFKARTGVDIQMWQDSVGADGINTRDPDDQFSLQKYINNISSKLGQDYTGTSPSVWTQTELVNCCTRTVDLSDGVLGNIHRPSLMARINNQLNMEGKASQRIAWSEARHMSNSKIISPAYDGNQEFRYAEATRLFNAYKGFFKIGGTNALKKFSYSWSLPSSDNIPERKTCTQQNTCKLNNLKTGNPNERVITQYTAQQAGLDWTIVQSKLINNGWAEPINSAQVLLTADLKNTTVRTAIANLLSSTFLSVLDKSIDPEWVRTNGDTAEITIKLLDVDKTVNWVSVHLLNKETKNKFLEQIMLPDSLMIYGGKSSQGPWTPLCFQNILGLIAERKNGEYVASNVNPLNAKDYGFIKITLKLQSPYPKIRMALSEIEIVK